MNIPQSAIEPFGIGIPSIYAIDTNHDIVELFGHTFLISMQASIQDTLERHPKKFSFVARMLMRMANDYAGVTRSRITITPDNKYWFEYEVGGKNYYQLMHTGP